MSKRSPREDFSIAPPIPAGGEPARDDAALAARCFRGHDGDALLRHLRRMTIEQRLPPDIPEGELRHVEGRRWLCSYIETLVARGRAG